MLDFLGAASKTKPKHTQHRLITFNGVTRGLEEWSRESGIPVGTISSRLRKGWPVDRALTEAVNFNFSRRKLGGRPRRGSVRRCPEMRKHSTGQAWARWWANGKSHDKYFGAWGSAEATKEYAKFAAKWSEFYSQTRLRVDAQPGQTVIVADLILRYLDWMPNHYIKNGKATSQLQSHKVVLGLLNDEFGSLPIDDFNGDHLGELQTKMIERGYVRDTTNARIGMIKKMFSRGVNWNLVRPETSARLYRFEQLASGRTTAPDLPRRPPAPELAILTLLNGDWLHPDEKRREILKAMIRVQLLTGMRPGELCAMTVEEIDRSRDIWTYAAVEHKNIHRFGKKHRRRIVRIGPNSQEILGPLLERAGSGFIFRLPNRRGKKRVDGELLHNDTPLTVAAYGRYIVNACKAAGVEVWTPHQLRHNHATEVQKKYEDDAATAKAIGDSPEVARQIYAHDPDAAVAERIAREMG